MGGEAIRQHAFNFPTCYCHIFHPLVGKRRKNNNKKKIIRRRSGGFFTCPAALPGSATMASRSRTGFPSRCESNAQRAIPEILPNPKDNSREKNSPDHGGIYAKTHMIAYVSADICIRYRPHFHPGLFGNCAWEKFRRRWGKEEQLIRCEGGCQVRDGCIWTSPFGNE